MNIEEFRKDGMIIQEYTTENIKEEYRTLLTEYRKKYFYQIIDTIQSHLRGISEYHIEEWIEEFLISNMKSEGYRQFNKMHASLETEFDSMYRSINANTNIERTIEEYQESLNYITRRTNLDWLEDLSKEFIQELKRKIEYYSISFLGLDDRMLERTIQNMASELNGTIRRVNHQFEEEYQQIMKNAIKKNCEDIASKMQSINLKNNKIPKEYFGHLEQILNYNGYQLLEENEELYIQDKTTQKIHAVTFDSRNNVIKNADETFGIQITGDRLTLLDIPKNTVISRDSISFEMSNLKREFRINITQGFIGYEFEYGGKKVTNLTEISAIIDSIKTKVPSYYEELLKEKDFQELMVKIEQHEKDNEEIYVDKTTNQVKLNPQNKEKATLKLKLFGYDLQEKEDGLYAIDIKTQEEHKIKTFTNSFGFEDKKAHELNFNTNLTIRTSNIIIPNNIEFHQGKNDLFINT